MARVRASLADAKTTSDETVVFGLVCRYYSGTASTNGQIPEGLAAKGVRIVELPCTGRVDVTHVLGAFESGADGVFVTGCTTENCHFNVGVDYAERMVARTKKLIEAAGIGANRLEVVKLETHEGQEILAKAAEVRDRIAQLGPSPLRKKA